MNRAALELPVVDCFKMLEKTQETPIYVILQTPWTEQNKTYAVTAEVKGIHLSAIGRHMETPADMPLVKHVREFIEKNDNGEPFYFMDWPKMI